MTTRSIARCCMPTKTQRNLVIQESIRLMRLPDLLLLSLICLPMVPLSASSTNAFQSPSARFQGVLPRFKLPLPEPPNGSSKGVREIDGNVVGHFRTPTFIAMMREIWSSFAPIMEQRRRIATIRGPNYGICASRVSLSMRRSRYGAV
jgi:hypothetical protein